ncbi:hypothetical protein [Clostridium sp. C2-6-12]|uniref:hypothetical protein n=1 Tax=Clostridium sp. C2-6-12 TaxID=2698832 RepID=UPI00136DFA79|nr:hypothetical protein [Clostridium sp. C2-6-12]
MKRITELNERIKLKEDLACEKLKHISSLLKYQYSINNTYEINKNEYSIIIEEEEVFVNHTYDIDKLLKIDVDMETRIIRGAFCMCIARIISGIV